MAQNGLVSILKPLERLFEHPVKIEMAERVRRQDLKGAPEGLAGAPPSFRCRVCGLEAAERDYCPACLADTMVPVEE